MFGVCFMFVSFSFAVWGFEVCEFEICVLVLVQSRCPWAIIWVVLGLVIFSCSFILVVR